MRKELFAAVLLTLMLPAAAEDAAPVSSLKADLDEVVSAGAVEPVGKVTSAGQPDRAALEVFSDSGYSTVIDIRGESENRGFDEAAVVEELGMRYLALPVSSAEDISFEKARQLGELIESQEGPVLVHCGSGNRVGALLALLESLEGASDEAAMETGRAAGLTRLEGTVRERLEER